MKEQMLMNDELVAEVQPGTSSNRKSYKVVAESGLFKNGKQYNKGEFVELDSKTAENFIAAGDIEKGENS